MNKDASIQEPKKDLVSRLKDNIRTKTAVVALTAAVALTNVGCNQYFMDGSTYNDYGYNQNRGMYFNPYMFQPRQMFMIGGAPCMFNGFYPNRSYPNQSMLSFYSMNGNTQVFFQISIGDIYGKPNGYFQYYNNGGFHPFQKNDYNHYFRNQDKMRDNNGRNYHQFQQQQRNNDYPLDKNYQPNIQKQNTQKQKIIPPRTNSKGRK